MNRLPGSSISIRSPIRSPLRICILVSITCLVVSLVVGLLALPAPSVLAQAPSTMSFQGVLTDNAGVLVPDGSYDLTFRIYDVAAGGAALWTEAQPGVPVVRGGFSVTLGLVTPIALVLDRTYFLGTTVGTDPELAPRVRLASSPYALGLRLPFAVTQTGPSPLLNLRNLTPGVPAIVADRRLDVGSAATDGEFLLRQAGAAPDAGRMVVNGLGGNFDLSDESGGHFVQLYADIDGEGGHLFIRRDNSFGGFIADCNYNNTNEPRVSITGSARSAVFDMSTPVLNNSVVLPNSAIASLEMFDEPGVASVADEAALAMDGNTQTLLSRTVSCPSDGYIVAIGSLQTLIMHTTGTTSTAAFGISRVAGTIPTTQDLSETLPSTLPTGNFTTAVSVHGVFPVLEGDNTLFLVGDEGTGVWTITDRSLALMFFPTAYGTVSPAAPGGVGTSTTAGTGRGLTPDDIAAERREARRFDEARLTREMSEMRARMDQLEREIAAAAAAQAEPVVSTRTKR
ncbi:MAG: hypothetical protein ACREOU_06135 [Candidatus Eiseniibacteriota bacterium]